MGNFVAFQHALTLWEKTQIWYSEAIRIKLFLSFGVWAAHNIDFVTIEKKMSVTDLIFDAAEL